MLAEVPADWARARVGTVGRVEAGKARNPNGPGQDRPYLRCANVHDGVIDASDLLTMPFTDAEFERFRLVPGDILLNEGQSIDLVGRPAVYRGSPPDVAMQNSLVRWRVHPDVVDAEFGYQLVRRLYQSGRLSQIATQTTSIAHLGVSRFAGVDVDIPPLPEQRKIAAILSSVDEAIQATQAVIDQTRRVKEGLLQDLLTRGIGHTRFKPIPNWTTGRIPELTSIPDAWSLVPICTVARLESGHTPSRKVPEYWDGEVQWLSLHDTKRMEAHVVNETTMTVTPAGIANSPARLLPAGTVALSRTATIGKCVILGREMATSQDFACYICGPRLHNKYLLHLFRYMGRVWDALSAGSTHQTVYMPIFEKLQIVLPSRPEQEQMARVLDGFDDQVISLQTLVASHKRVKSGLLQDLLTGRVRVTP